MDLSKAIAELREERDLIDEAILVFARLAAGASKRRGRPPKWLAELTTGAEAASRKSSIVAVPQATPSQERKGMSAAARKAVSERMKKYWAAKKAKA